MAWVASAEVLSGRGLLLRTGLPPSGFLFSLPNAHVSLSQLAKALLLDPRLWLLPALPVVLPKQLACLTTSLPVAPWADSEQMPNGLLC